MKEQLYTVTSLSILLLSVLSHGVSSFLPPLNIKVIVPTTAATNTLINKNHLVVLRSTTPEENSAQTEETENSYTIPYEENSHEELIYTLGINLARQLGDVRPLVEDGTELSMVAKGILDALVGRIEDKDQRALLARRKNDLNALVTERANNIKKRLEESGRAILKEMSEQDDVLLLPSGVVVHPLEAGPEGFNEGVRPSLSSTVTVHYHGTLPDGTVFDSTLNKDPVTFAVGQVIPGWKEALQKMHEGETAMIGIPPEMGYGAEGSPDGRIPGGATLFFKVQLVEVLTAGLGGSIKLLGKDGEVLNRGGSSGTSGLLGLDGKPLG